MLLFDWKGAGVFMEYNDLTNEYDSLLKERIAVQITLARLRHGYISYKTISGKTYPYLQYRVEGRLYSKYVGDGQLQSVIDELKMRTVYLERTQAIDERLDKIEAAAGILDQRLLRKLVTLRRCAEMDALSPEEREKSLLFSSAMTALEGIPAGHKVEKRLSQWANGEMSFQDSFLETLSKYRLAGV